METPVRKLGIIAGGGAAPHRVVAMCRKTGRPFFLFCLEGQADSDLGADAPHAWLPLGAGGRLCALCREQGVADIVMIGRVRRPSLAELKPDLWTLKNLTRVGMNALGDDGLLRAVGGVLEKECGVHMIGVQEVFADLLAPVGCLTETAPDAEAQADLDRGVAVARALGTLDVGQAVVVQQGLVLGVEAIEGTDALLARAGGLRREGAGGVLVKWAKPQQDKRLDLPTIGPATIAGAVAAGLRGVAVTGGRSLIVDRDDVVRLADEASFFVIGLADRDDAL